MDETTDDDKPHALDLLMAQKRRIAFLEAGLEDIIEAWKYQDPDKMRDIAENALRRANRR